MTNQLHTRCCHLLLTMLLIVYILEGRVNVNEIDLNFSAIHENKNSNKMWWIIEQLLCWTYTFYVEKNITTYELKLYSSLPAISVLGSKQFHSERISDMSSIVFILNWSKGQYWYGLPISNSKWSPWREISLWLNSIKLDKTNVVPPRRYVDEIIH